MTVVLRVRGLMGDTGVAVFLLDWSVPQKFIMSHIKSTLPKLWTLFSG